jgi:Mn2+/Fe2+ NRAMP family transporter
MSKDLLNIVGLVNSLVLVIAIILSWYAGSKISKMEFGKIPIISTTVLVLVWWLFVYWAIAVI